MLEVAPVEEDRLLRRPVAPVRRRVVERRRRWPGREAPNLADAAAGEVKAEGIRKGQKGAEAEERRGRTSERKSSRDEGPGEEEGREGNGGELRD